MVNRGAEGQDVDVDWFMLVFPYKMIHRPHLHPFLSCLCTQGTGTVVRRVYARILSDQSQWHRTLGSLEPEVLVHATFVMVQRLVLALDRDLLELPDSYRDNSSGI